MAIHIGRREFIVTFGGAAAWPLVARAQQAAMPVIGYFDWGERRPNGRGVAAFRQGLAEAGYVEGRNVAIEYRWAEGQYSRLPQLAADLVNRQVAVIVATGALETAIAAKAATATIPIVVAAGGDPVKSGLAASLNRPGGNVTGMTFISEELGDKRLDLLHKIVPQVTKVGFLSGGPQFRVQENVVLSASRQLGLQLIIVEARSESDIEEAFASLVRHEVGALIVSVVPILTANNKKIVALAARHKLPAIYPFSIYTIGGGLMSYGADMGGNLRQVGVNYVGRILNGAKPADLPIQQPSKFPLMINLKTVKALGLEVPPMLLVAADEVIE